MVPLALKAAAMLERDGVQVEVIDPRTISPLDRNTICDSVSKTRRLVVVDPAWQSFGAGAEIVSSVVERVGDILAAKPVRVSLPDSHTPMSSALEREYYPDEYVLRDAIRGVMGQTAGAGNILGAQGQFR
jgi:pyruvate dehydrogenase E1 component beta subunit